MSNRHYRGGGKAAQARRRHNWLELVHTTGPWLTLPVVDRVFPNGLPGVAPEQRAELRALVGEMLDEAGSGRHRLIEAVLREAFDWGDHLDLAVPDAMAEPVADHGLVLRADFAFYAEASGADQDSLDGDVDRSQNRGAWASARIEVGQDSLDDDADGRSGGDDEDASDRAGDVKPSEVDTPWRLLGMVSEWGTNPFARTATAGWSASPVERLAVLLRARGVPVGLVTDGRWWALVWAPVGGTTAAGLWDASLWSEEPESLAALVALLRRSQWLAVPLGDTLPELFKEGLNRQEEVTETLGRQVRDAVELLVDALSVCDARSGGALLSGVSDDDVYDGAVSFMMRLVFLLFAEERRLLPSDDATYLKAYSAGDLVEQLEARVALAGPQALEHRTGAWHRLLAVSRAIHQGVAHEDLRLPAYGGGLFDPDRYPWLEGRCSAEADLGATPPPIDDRTVLAMLLAVQYVEVGGERRRLTFRALDVEQIGYVYEGLLEYEARTASEPVICLVRPTDDKKAKAPSEVPLSELTAVLDDTDAGEMVKWVTERTSASVKRVSSVLDTEPSADQCRFIRRILGCDEEVARSVARLAPLMRQDDQGHPVIITAGGRYVAPSTRRAATGTHYTPRALAEDVADNALEPLVWRPGPLESADRASWRLRPSSEILGLRVADIAMGSGAFLVAACRYLADRLVEAWEAEGRPDAARALGEAKDRGALVGGAARSAGRSGDSEWSDRFGSGGTERKGGWGGRASDAEVPPVLLEARRLVVEHCLYGVDINPLAVEMAKLSLWLVTMDRSRPFGFLDDRLRCGDSLLGVVSASQLEYLHLDAEEGRRMHAGQLWENPAEVRALLQQTADLRRRITAQPVITLRDVEHKARLLAEAEERSAHLRIIADALTGAGLAQSAKLKRNETDRFAILGDHFNHAVTEATYDYLARQAQFALQWGRPPETTPRSCLHWPVEFPEVFADSPQPGFDAIIGNPPFSGGQKISGRLGGPYGKWLQYWDGKGVKGSADLVSRFVLRANRLLSARGQLGFVACNTLVEGATLRVGLLQATEGGLSVRRGTTAHPWPSASANVSIVNLWATRQRLGPKARCWLDGEEVKRITPDLQPLGRVEGRPFALRENEGVAFQGSNVLGLGFTLTHEQAAQMIDDEPMNKDILARYVIGKDLNQRPDCSASRWIINFHNWPLERCEKYIQAMDIVRRLVKPERDRQKDRQRREIWWRFTRPAPELYETIDGLDHALAISLVGNALLPVRVPTGPVFSHGCGVFALDDFASLALLSSSVHSTWVIRYTSTLETRIRYAPSDVFLTLARPALTPTLAVLGEQLDRERRALMLGRSWGLTTTYNYVHDRSDHDNEVVNLRDIHEAIDRATFAAYGWEDLDPQVGHHRTKIGERWTISPEVRLELLDRLLEENHRRHAAESG